MGKQVTKVHNTKGESRHRSTALVLVSVAFLLGGLLGYLIQEKLPGSPYVHVFLKEARDHMIQPNLWQEIWRVFRWPVGLLVLRSLPFTGLSVPIWILIRGFMLSYSISAFTLEEVRFAVLLFGPSCILTLPVLFLMSTEILLRKVGEPTERKPAVILACLLSLILCMVIDLAVVPMLLT